MGLPLLLQAVIAINLLRYIPSVQLVREADGSQLTTLAAADSKPGLRGSGTLLQSTARELLSEGRIDAQDLHVSHSAALTANHLLTVDEALSFLSTYFKELEPAAAAQPWSEQQQHAAVQKVSAAAWQLFTHTQGMAAEQRQWRTTVLLAVQQLQHGMQELQQAVCAVKERAAAAAAPPLPAFAATRRVALAAAHALLGKLHAAPQTALSAEAFKLIQQVDAAGQQIIMAAHATEQCSLAARPVLEALHVSKAGGSSMCELARLASENNPNFNAGRNCMIDDFGDEPRWVEQAPEFVPDMCKGKTSVWMFSSGECASWLQRPETTCAQRMAATSKNNITFYMNEVALHGGEPGQQAAQPSASTCPGMRSLVVLRPPLERLASHILHAKTLVERDMRFACEMVMKQAARVWEITRRQQQAPVGQGAAAAAGGGPSNTTLSSPPAAPAALTNGWHLPVWSVRGGLQDWQAIMPAAVDNYALRHLLGRWAHCRRAASPLNESAFTASDWAAGAAKLVAMDHVLLLPPAAGGGDEAVEQAVDTVMRAGMRWPWSLSNIHWRKAKTKHFDFEKNLGFPSGTASALQAINKWDTDLYTRVARPALLLDASYYATAALLNGCVATAEEAQRKVNEEEARLGTCPEPAKPAAAAGIGIVSKTVTTTHVSATVTITSSQQTATTHAAPAAVASTATSSGATVHAVDPAAAQHGQQSNELPPGVTWAWDAAHKHQSRSLLARINSGAGKLASTVDSMLRKAGISSPLVPLQALAPRSSKPWEQQAPVKDYVHELQNAPESVEPAVYMGTQPAAAAGSGRRLLATGSNISPSIIAAQRSKGPFDCHGRPVPRTTYRIESFSDFQTNLGKPPPPPSTGSSTATMPGATIASTKPATAAAAAAGTTTAAATVGGSSTQQQQQQQQQLRPGPYPLNPRFLLFGTNSRLASPDAAHAFSFSSCQRPAA